MSAIAAVLLATAAGAACSAHSGEKPTVVVELFTSQGCSSCPPADRWLSRLRERHGENVIPLSMHVGYWDYIGWKDPFARREFNERQRLLASSSGSRTVYTPGVFVQGREFSNWSQAASFDAAVRTVQGRPTAAQVSLTVSAIAQQSVSVRIQGKAPSGARLWLALVQGGLTTAVNAGENRGEKLRNDHVVRDWSGPHRVGDLQQSLTFPADKAPRPRDWAVVALIDDASGATLQATRVALSTCGALVPS